MSEMKTILTVNGTQYSVQAPPGYVLRQADIEKAKQDILSGKIRTLNPATCADVVQNTTHDVTLTATGGQPNYTYRLLLDGTQIDAAGPIAATSQVFSVNFNQAVGAHTLRGEVTDSCSTPQTSGDQCTTFNILAPVTTGSILCTTTPAGAAVYLDDSFQKVVTPITLTDVPVGSHTVGFTLSGYDACSVPVTVTAGAVEPASCILIPSTGSISCTTTPSGAAVYLDDSFQKVVTPITLMGVTVGSHIVKFTLIGYDACSVPVIVTEKGVDATCILTLACSKLSITIGIV